MRFTWNPEKAVANVRKHGVTFAEARTVFVDPLSRIALDRSHSSGEERLFLIGCSSLGRLIVVWHVESDDEVVRIIGAREPTRTERRHYEEAVKP
jgi:uncharacterized DUF497 family protein